MKVKDFCDTCVVTDRDKIFIMDDTKKIDWYDVMCDDMYNDEKVKRIEIDAFDDEYDGGHVIIYLYV